MTKSKMYPCSSPEAVHALSAFEVLWWKGMASIINALVEGDQKMLVKITPVGPFTSAAIIEAPDKVNLDALEKAFLTAKKQGHLPPKKEDVTRAFARRFLVGGVTARNLVAKPHPAIEGQIR